jgi:hypothetical protein
MNNTIFRDSRWAVATYNFKNTKETFCGNNAAILYNRIFFFYLLDELKEKRGYSHLKEEDLDRTMWRARFGRGFGPVVRQTAK